MSIGGLPLPERLVVLPTGRGRTGENAAWLCSVAASPTHRAESPYVTWTAKLADVGGRWSKSSHPDQQSNDRDPSKSRSFRIQCLAQSDTSERGRSPAPDENRTYSEQIPHTSLRSDYAHSMHKAEARAPAMPVDLQTIIEAWDDLPHPVKAGIMAMVRTTTDDAQR